jgi:hypothetical protein
MNLPKFIVIYAAVLLTIREIRLWTDLYLSYSESDEDKKDDEIPDSIRHLYS